MTAQDRIERCLDGARLADGWLDGRGLGPAAALLDRVGRWLAEHLRGDARLPRLYPTAEGGVEAEWMLGRLDLSIEFDPLAGQVAWHALDLDTDALEDEVVSLDDAEALHRLGSRLAQQVAAAPAAHAKDHAEVDA